MQQRLSELREEAAGPFQIQEFAPALGVPQEFDVPEVPRTEARRAERLREQILDPGRAREQIRVLQEVRAETGRTEEEILRIDRAITDLNIRQLESSTNLVDGFRRAFLMIGQEAQDAAFVGESSLLTFVDRTAEGLSRLTTEGRLNFREFTLALIDDINQIIQRFLVLQLVQQASGFFD